MKIRKLYKDNINSPGIRENNPKYSIEQAGQSFGDHLYKIQNDFIHQKLESLFKDIDEQGKILGQTLNIKDLKKYKDLIQKFLDYTVNKMYHLNEQGGLDRKGRYKIYTIIETVNKELENLTNMLLLEQKEKLSILAKVDEIRGLIIDLYS